MFYEVRRWVGLFDGSLVTYVGVSFVGNFGHICRGITTYFRFQISGNVPRSCLCYIVVCGSVFQCVFVIYAGVFDIYLSSNLRRCSTKLPLLYCSVWQCVSVWFGHICRSIMTYVCFRISGDVPRSCLCYIVGCYSVFQRVFGHICRDVLTHICFRISGDVPRNCLRQLSLGETQGLLWWCAECCSFL